MPVKILNDCKEFLTQVLQSKHQSCKITLCGPKPLLSLRADMQLQIEHGFPRE
jgi:hypothetical protein